METMPCAIVVSTPSPPIPVSEPMADPSIGDDDTGQGGLQAARHFRVWRKRMARNPMAMPALWLAAAVIILDQITKQLILHVSGIAGPLCSPQNPRMCGQIDISPFFDLTMVWNTGVSFGLFSEGVSTRILSLVIVAVLIGAIAWATKRAGSKWGARILVGLGALIVLVDLAFILLDGVYSGLLVWMTSRVSLSILSIIAATGLFWWLASQRRFFAAIAIGLIIGGALGNAYDRIVYGGVVDFLDFSGLFFPWVFNVADAAINIGFVCLLYDAFFRQPAQARDAETPSARR